MGHEKRIEQIVPFRLIKMPCCGTMLCYVNPRLPNFCSECGERVYIQIRSGQCTMVEDLGARLLTLRY